MRRDKQRPGTPRRVRVTFHAPPEFTAGACVWANLREAPTRALALVHEYPDLAPTIGWHVAVEEKLYQITSESEGWFALSPLEGGAA